MAATPVHETAEGALRQQFLGGMSYAACTVNIITTDGTAGRAGVTVSAMSSVSADSPKPTLLVCVHHLSPAAAAMLENGVFCVNVLRDDQSYISDTFAGRFKDDVGDKFACAEWTAQKTGSPRLLDPLVAFDCTVTSAEKVGTHHVFVGEVEDIFVSDGGSPLIYANRAYGTPARVERVASLAEGARRDGTKLKVGCFHTFGPYVLPAILGRFCAASAADVQIVEGDHRRLLDGLGSGEIDVALIYDFSIGEKIRTDSLTELHPYVLLAESSPLASEHALTLERLAEEPLVLLDASPSADYFLSIFSGRGLEANVRFRIRSFEIVRGLVAHGLGYTILATKPASNMSYDGKALASRPLPPGIEPSRLVLARREGVADSPSVELFCELCREHFGVGAAR